MFQMPHLQLLRDYQEMMAAAFCKECHILPSEAVMYEIGRASCRERV